MVVRLDIHITRQHPDLTRSHAKRLIEEGYVKLRGAVCKKVSQTVKDGDEVIVQTPPPKASGLEPQDIPLDILYEDSDIIVVNKSAGMVVHPAVGNFSGTLVNALLHHCKDLSGIGGEARPGIVHRLDKGTSGVMVVAKNDVAHVNLSAQFKGRKIEKRYYALIYGKLPKQDGSISAPIGRHASDRKRMSTKTKHGRTAETHYHVVKRIGDDLTFVDVRLATGRTHQIRVHFSHIGHPLVGDAIYGGKAIKRLNPPFSAKGGSASGGNKGGLGGIIKPFSRPALHAYKLAFDHPRTGEFLTFTAPLPADMKDLLDGLGVIHIPPP